jgi:hypothetical protein
MINFQVSICPKCGKRKKLMLSNNPLSGNTICFDCINEQLDYNNIEHAEFFCRTYNLPWKPELWLNLVTEHGASTFEEYTTLVLEDKADQPNLAYTSTTKDLWSRTNKEWEKCRTFTQILKKLTPIRESYLDRGHLKWGEQYTFEELIQLDSMYTRTLKANNITNPLQKEAVKTLCKIHIEMNEAIRAKDAKAMKDYSSSYSTFAKEANLEGMINETKTEDITTVAELYDYMERSGFKFKFYDGYDRDEVDSTIKDIQDTNRRLILESTGLQPLLEEMARQRMTTVEEEHTKEVIDQPGATLQDLINFKPEDNEVDTEDDAAATELQFDQEDESC